MYHYCSALFISLVDLTSETDIIGLDKERWNRFKSRSRLKILFTNILFNYLKKIVKSHREKLIMLIARAKEVTN